MYLEQHDILFFDTICQDKYALDSNDKPKSRTTETRQNENFEVPFNRLKETDTNFWTRTATYEHLKQAHTWEWVNEIKTDKNVSRILRYDLQWDVTLYMATSLSLWLL